jgi:hypothetical protein
MYYKDGSQIATYSSASSYTISNARPSDSGSYFCKAVRKYFLFIDTTEETSSIWFSVQGKGFNLHMDESEKGVRHVWKDQGTGWWRSPREELMAGGLWVLESEPVCLAHQELHTLPLTGGLCFMLLFRAVFHTSAESQTHPAYRAQ